MKDVLKALNQLVADGVIEAYALGGAVAAAFYIEALQTEDIDAFVFFPPSASGLLSLTPIYNALVALGGVVEQGHVRFGEWPLQILPDLNPLVTEAIRTAIDVDFEDIPTRVFRAEHLVAIALQIGRPKDYLRVKLFLEQNAVDQKSLSDVAARFGLVAQLAKVSSP